MNSKTTKKAFASSVLAMVVCLAMLVGTTFAWFTDTATTGVNKIVSGNLDVELSYKNSNTAEKFTKVNKDTPVFNENALWEPGHVEYVVLKVSNAGSLALKYKLGINIANEVGSTNVGGDPFKLSDYIRFAVIDGDKTEGDINRDDMVKAAGEGTVLSTGYTAEDHMLSGNEKVVTLVVWMPTTVGNEANHMTDETAPSIDLGITVVAAQDTVERDSFDNMYDEKATYPLLTQSDVADAIAEGKKDITLGTGEYTLYQVDSSKTQNTSLTLTGAGADKTTFSVGAKVSSSSDEYKGDYSYDNSDVIFRDMTIKMSVANYMGFIRAKSLLFENCRFEGMGSYWGVGTVTFKNCTFADNKDYNLWAYSGADFTFENCTFMSSIG